MPTASLSSPSRPDADPLKDATGHPVFAAFPPWSGPVDMSQYSPNPLGVRTRRLFTQNMAKGPAAIPPSQEKFFHSQWPPVSEEFFEWIDLLEAVSQAHQAFTMIELGAGYGRWLVNAAAALRQRGHHDFRLIGVEAEPTHFQWMKVHFADNGLDPDQHWLIEAAITTHRKGAWFTVGRPDAWYGQAIVPSPQISFQTQRVETVTLDFILARCDRVDFVDLDIQGLELDVLAAATKNLHRKVKRVHIGTHSPMIEQGLRQLFFDLGWTQLADFSSGTTVQTPYGQTSFRDGVQSWLNPQVAAESAGGRLPLGGLRRLRSNWRNMAARVRRRYRGQGS
jgi:FkbM family methyltransferase